MIWKEYPYACSRFVSLSILHVASNWEFNWHFKPKKKGVNATLFALALITATTRTVIRVHSQRQLHPDDYILMFACATLIASQVLLYVLRIEVIYYDARKILDPVSGNILFFSSVADGSHAEVLRRRVSNPQPILFSSLALSWTCIYTVKICFLLFFHQLITRLRRWILAWKVIFGITIIFWAYCASAVFIGCPKFAQLACTSVPPIPNLAPSSITAADKPSAHKVQHLKRTLLWPLYELF